MNDLNKSTIILVEIIDIDIDILQIWNDVFTAICQTIHITKSLSDSSPVHISNEVTHVLVME